MIGTIALVVVAVIGALFVAFVLLDATRGTPVSYVSARGEELPVAVGDPAFTRMLEAYTSTALREGHEVELLANGDNTYPRLWDDIRRAQRYVAIQMYYCTEGRLARELRDALVERARAGIPVLFLYDAFGSSLGRKYIRSLRDGGVEVAAFRGFQLHLLHTLHHRAHLRAVVVDGAVGYTGGFGIDDKWLGDGCTNDAWRDTNVRFTGPAVAQLLATFATCWAEATEELIAATRFWAGDGDTPAASRREPASEPALAGLLHAAPVVGSTAGERFFALCIAGARERLYITNSYFVPDDDFRRLVKDAARRGVDVRILTANRRSDVRSTHWAARARYDELLSSGVRIFEYQPSMMHAKTVVVDGLLGTVGSMNTDNRSVAFNNECNLIVRDPVFAETLERVFHDDCRRATEIDLETFRRRPLYKRALEQGAHLLSRIL